jgi:hypothetical protein
MPVVRIHGLDLIRVRVSVPRQTYERNNQDQIKVKIGIRYADFYLLYFPSLNGIRKNSHIRI